MGTTAKKTAAKPSKAVAVREAAAVPAVVDANLPAFLAGYKGPLGTENIDRDDVTIPRLKIGQGMTPEVKDGDMQEGSLFLNVTGQAVWVPGDAPLPFVIIARSKEYILWRPREDNGGGILDRAKPVKDKSGVTRYRWGKPNSAYEVKVGGKIKVTWKTKEFIDQDGLGEWGSEIPGDKESGIAATAHHNYLVTLPTVQDTLAALSMSRSQVKKAKDLNAVLKMGAAPVHARKFVMTTKDEVGQSSPDPYKNYSIQPDGFVDEATFNKLTPLAKGFAEQGFTVDQSDDDADTGDNTSGAI